jgi:hypothetical protein
MAFSGSQWAVKYTIPTAGVPADVSDFAVLLTEANLPADLLDTSSGKSAKADGGDLLAYLQDPTGGVEPATRFPIDIRTFSTGAGGTTRNSVRVGLPNVSSSVASTFWLVWGSAGSQPAVDAAYGRNAVYPAARYAAVLAFESDPSGGAPQLIDRTGNGNDGTSIGGMVSGDLVDGVSGKAWDFDGAGQQADCGLGITWGSGEDLWVSLWYKYQTTNPFFEKLFTMNGNFSGQDLLQIDAGNLDRPRFLIDSDGTLNIIQSSVAGAVGAWQRLAGSRVGSSGAVFLNGIQRGAKTVQTGALAPPEQLVVAGFPGDVTFAFDGSLDEMFIGRGSYDANDDLANYNNESSPGTFATAGAIQPIVSAAAAPYPLYYWYQ